MPLKLVNAAKIDWLDVLRVQRLGNLTARLYKNNHTPADADTSANYTVANFDGYSEIDMGGWTAAILAANHALSQATPLVWICTGAGTPNDVYGWFVVVRGTNDLVWAERFTAAPLPMNQAGDQITVNPVITDASEF